MHCGKIIQGARNQVLDCLSFIRKRGEVVFSFPLKAGGLQALSLQIILHIQSPGNSP